ncbi:hypothetical protein [Hominifimenecus sp. rT4P-3]|uniref:hypothetical protein n=1 Tax=Hominifimenecus sp. rT4P-3 TaxID=3242979 RepID=UPI003DA6A6EA
MGTTHKTDFKVFNGTDYDQHYFSTSADQVNTNSGGTVETALTSLQNSKINCSDIVLASCVLSWGSMGRNNAGVIEYGYSGTISFPPGFTRENTVILALMARANTSTNPIPIYGMDSYTASIEVTLYGIYVNYHPYATSVDVPFSFMECPIYVQAVLLKKNGMYIGLSEPAVG